MTDSVVSIELEQRADLVPQALLRIRVRAAADGSAVVRMSGALDLASVSEVSALLGDLIDAFPRPTRITVDLADLEFLAAAGINTLLTAEARAQRADITVRVIGCRPFQRRMFHLVGAHRLLTASSAARDGRELRTGVDGVSGQSGLVEPAGN